MVSKGRRYSRYTETVPDKKVLKVQTSCPLAPGSGGAGGRVAVDAPLPAIVHANHASALSVIVNELGEQAIDNDLVEVSSEQMMLLNNGCLCCVLRGDLQETMRDLFIKRRNGVIMDFDRLVIETTGLADPAPVMQTLMTDTMLQSQYRLDCVVTLVDAVNGLEQLNTLSEPVKQAALADRLADALQQDQVPRRGRHDRQHDQQHLGDRIVNALRYTVSSKQLRAAGVRRGGFFADNMRRITDGSAAGRNRF